MTKTTTTMKMGFDTIEINLVKVNIAKSSDGAGVGRGKGGVKMSFTSLGESSIWCYCTDIKMASG